MTVPSRIPRSGGYTGPARAPAPLASVRRRESRHRRALLLGIAGLLLLALTPVLGRHVLGAVHGWTVGTSLHGVDHIGALCLVALHQLLAPVHALFHVLVSVGFAYALWDRLRAWRRARRTLASLDARAPEPGDAFSTAAVRVGIPAARIRVVAGLPTPAFTAGWLRPLVYVARALGDGPRAVTPDELAAVLAHEQAHLRRRDPLRFSALRVVARTLFWIPALDGLVADVADEAEVRADDAAAAATDPLTLAGVLVALAGWGLGTRRAGGSTGSGAEPGWGAGYAVGFVQGDLLERRVRQLAGEHTVPTSRVSRRSVVGAALVLAVVWTSGLVDVHALPRDLRASRAGVPASADLHCFHRHASTLSHLFCRHGRHGGWFTRGGTDCPHHAGAGVRA